MTTGTSNPLLAPFLAAADAAATTRPEVDAELARELMGEAATLLHNGLALEGLDEHDTRAAIDALAQGLVEPDPAAAVRDRAEAARADSALHEPEVVAGSLLVAAAILGL